VIQDLSGSWCIKETGESMTRVDSPVPLMYMIQTDLGSLIRIRITPKERSLIRSGFLYLHKENIRTLLAVFPNTVLLLLDVKL